MATPDQIAELRRLINEPTQTPYTDETLSVRLDAAMSATELAGTIWREKAATYAGLIDVQEGNSNRKMSQLHSQALRMADSFAPSSGSTTGFRPARTRPIERQ